MTQILASIEPSVAHTEIWKQVAKSLAARETREVQSLIQRFVKVRDAWLSDAREFAKSVNVDPVQFDLESLSVQLTRIVAQKDQLADWTRWSVAQGVAEAAGLGSLLWPLVY